VTKTLLEQKDIDPVGVFVMLAAHGSMCNIQKELGIGMAYSLLNNSVKADQDKLSLPVQLSRLLLKYRQLVVEAMFMAHASTKNSHPLVKFSNDLADFTGIPKLPVWNGTAMPCVHCVGSGSPLACESFDVRTPSLNSLFSCLPPAFLVFRTTPVRSTTW
jgi:hypothetical protein